MPAWCLPWCLPQWSVGTGLQRCSIPAAPIHSRMSRAIWFGFARSAATAHVVQTPVQTSPATWHGAPPTAPLLPGAEAVRGKWPTRPPPFRKRFGFCAARTPVSCFGLTRASWIPENASASPRATQTEKVASSGQGDPSSSARSPKWARRHLARHDRDRYQAEPCGRWYPRLGRPPRRVEPLQGESFQRHWGRRSRR